jgi:hypothetical protein
MGRCPDCGEIIHKDLEHLSCPHPGEKRHMIAMLKADLAESELQLEAAGLRIEKLEGDLASTGKQLATFDEMADDFKRAADKAEKERDEARANYQTMLDENVSNIERAQKAEKERDELMPIAEAAKTCMKACVIAPKRDSRCPNCECLIVCDALKAADIQITAADGEAAERLGE